MSIPDIVFDAFRTLPSELGFVRARELRRQAAELERQADELEHQAALDLFAELRPQIRQIWDDAIERMKHRKESAAQCAPREFDTPAR